jgi:hypothetical protein
VTRRFLSLFAAVLLVVAAAGPAGADPLPVHCPDGSRIVVDEFTSDDAGTEVTATFTIPASCQDIKLTLATYAISPDGSETALHASASGIFDGGPGKQQLTVDGPGCDQDVYLVVGSAKDDPATYGDNEIVDIGSDETFGDCGGFDPPPSSSTTTTTTTTTTTPTPTTEPEGEDCHALQPSNKIDADAKVVITGDTARATFTVLPGCGTLELSMATYTISLGGRELIDSTTGRFGPGTHTAVLPVTLRPGCQGQASLAVGKPDPDIFKLIRQGRLVTSATDDTGAFCDPRHPDNGRPGGTNGNGHGGTLPFTGAGLFVPLLAGGLTLMVVGVVTVATTRRKGPRQLG